MSYSRKEIDKLLDALAAMIGGGYKGSIAGIMSNAQLAQAIKAIEIGDIDKLMQAVTSITLARIRDTRHSGHLSL